MPWYRLTTGYERQRCLIIGVDWSRQAVSGKGRTTYAIHDRRPPEGWKREPYGILRKTIDGTHHLRPEAVWGKALGESPNRSSTHRLRAIHDHAQRTEIQSDNVFITDILAAQLECEIRRRRKRGAMP
jgi:hypothetical protein